MTFKRYLLVFLEPSGPPNNYTEIDNTCKYLYRELIIQKLMKQIILYTNHRCNNLLIIHTIDHSAKDNAVIDATDKFLDRLISYRH